MKKRVLTLTSAFLTIAMILWGVGCTEAKFAQTTQQKTVGDLVNEIVGNGPEAVDGNDNGINQGDGGSGGVDNTEGGTTRTPIGQMTPEQLAQVINDPVVLVNCVEGQGHMISIEQINQHLADGTSLRPHLEDTIGACVDDDDSSSSDDDSLSDDDSMSSDDDSCSSDDDDSTESRISTPMRGSLCILVCDGAQGDETSSDDDSTSSDDTSSDDSQSGTPKGTCSGSNCQE